MKRILALLLVLALVLSLPVPVTAAAGSYAPQEKNTAYIGNSYVYPFAQVIDASVLDGSTATLRFKLGRMTPSSKDLICIHVLRGGYSLSAPLKENLRSSAESWTFKVSQFTAPNYSVAVTLKADYRYVPGSYTVVCYAANAKGEPYENQNPWYTHLQIVKEEHETELYRIHELENGHLQESGSESVDLNEEIWLVPLAWTGDRIDQRNWSVTCDVPEVANVRLDDAGYIRVTGKAVGETLITVKCGNSSESFRVRVRGKLNSFQLHPSANTLCVGMTDTIGITASPSNLPVYYSWYTSNPEIATVKNGFVTALSPGYVVISVEGAGIHHGTGYTVSYHELPEGTPVTERTATQPVMSIGHCSACGQDNCVNLYEKAIFTDTNYKAWYAPHVDYVYDKGIMIGMNATTFAPDRTMTRAELVTVLYRLADSPEVSGELPFTDTAAGQWYSDAVLWASQNDIVNGVGDNRFAPTANITREQIATILYRYTQTLGVEMAEGADLAVFPDYASLSDYAQEAMEWAVAEELINGIASDGKTTLSPQSTATRAQLATIISRYQQMFQ